MPATRLSAVFSMLRRSLGTGRSRRVPRGVIPVEPLTRALLDVAPDMSLFRLGHSTVLLKLQGAYWLTDPIFSRRSSPVQWAGPKRFHAPAITIDALPPLAGVMLSHDHHDHMDYASILQLAPKTEVFLAPKGVGDRLLRWGVDPAKVRQLGWWDETAVRGVRFVAVPARHFSGRGLTDFNSTLWASWAILADGMRLFFSGDTGYHADFRTARERFGAFDLAMLETGAYDLGWPEVHMQPEQTLQAHRDLGARWLLPIHNGTFNLGLHAWDEPFMRISALCAKHGEQLSTPVMGERVSLTAPHAGSRWWEDVTQK